MLRFLIIILVIIAVLTGIFFLIGAVSPKSYEGEVSITVNCTQEEVWEQLTNIEGLAGKREQVDSVQVLEWENDRPKTWKEYAGKGNYITFEAIERQEPHTFSVRIVESTVGMQGQWSYHLQPENGATEVTIHEESVVNDIFLRSLFTIMGRDATLNEEKRLVRMCEE